MPVSKQIAKFIKSLQNKKHRNETKHFLVEGEKSIKELLASDFDIQNLLLTEQACELLNISFDKANVVSLRELSSLTSLKTNSFGIAVVKMKEKVLKPPSGWDIVIEGINDPGNLGTIIRIADWYNINQIILSENSVDNYNPKVIMSSMGSFLRVDVFYCQLLDFLRNDHRDIYFADLNGHSVHDVNFPANGILVLGSESHGISQTIKKLHGTTVTIPGRGAAESLNVAVSAAIISDNIFRTIPEN